jgi:hypothetical protein
VSGRPSGPDRHSGDPPRVQGGRRGRIQLRYDEYAADRRELVRLRPARQDAEHPIADAPDVLSPFPLVGVVESLEGCGEVVEAADPGVGGPDACGYGLVDRREHGRVLQQAQVCVEDRGLVRADRLGGSVAEQVQVADRLGAGSLRPLRLPGDVDGPIVAEVHRPGRYDRRPDRQVQAGAAPPGRRIATRGVGVPGTGARLVGRGRTSTSLVAGRRGGAREVVSDKVARAEVVSDKVARAEVVSDKVAPAEVASAGPVGRTGFRRETGDRGPWDSVGRSSNARAASCRTASRTSLACGPSR